MASFNTHLSVGIAVSGVAATAAMMLGLAERHEVIPWFLLGAVGSLLPDMDADYSTPLQIAFTASSILCAFLIMFAAALQFSSLAELLSLWLLAYLVIRWGVFHLFTRYTSHRGMIHSLPVALLAGSLTAIISYWLLAQPPLKAWIAGAFVMLGYLVHLLLDEISAINLFGIRSRRSFGSAMKLWYRHSWRSTLAAYVLLVLSLPLLPPSAPLLKALAELEPERDLTQQLWPQGHWFDIQ